MTEETWILHLLGEYLYLGAAGVKKVHLGLLQLKENFLVLILIIDFKKFEILGE